MFHNTIIFLDINGVLLQAEQPDLHYKAFYKNQDQIDKKIGLKNIKENLPKGSTEASIQTAVSLYEVGGALSFSADAVDRLKCLCQETDAKIVISSAWRNRDNKLKKESIQKLRWLFSFWDLDHLIIDQTPNMMVGDRSDEIQAWLDQQVDPDQISFVVLDDNDMGLSERFRNRFIYTGDKMLFSEKHLEKALVFLNLK